MSNPLEWLSHMEEPEPPETPPVETPPEAPPVVEGTPPAATTPPAVEPPAAVPPSPTERTLQDLQTLLREQSRKIAQLETKLNATPKPAAPGSNEWESLENEPPELTPEPPKPSIIESLHQNLAAVAENRGSIFELQLEMMGELPAYKDIADVCSQANFDFIISNAARHYSADKSIPLEQAMLEIENTIWMKPNPYKYMYKVIKDVHPKYKSAPPPVTPPGGPPKPPAEPPPVPDSIAGAGGSGGTGTSGWTAAKIDAMSEEDLSKVPRDIYDKWLAGELK